MSTCVKKRNSKYCLLHFYFRSIVYSVNGDGGHNFFEFQIVYKGSSSCHRADVQLYSGINVFNLFSFRRVVFQNNWPITILFCFLTKNCWMKLENLMPMAVIPLNSFPSRQTELYVRTPMPVHFALNRLSWHNVL